MKSIPIMLAAMLSAATAHAAELTVFATTSFRPAPITRSKLSKTPRGDWPSGSKKVRHSTWPSSVWPALAR
jgi:hypothetical protein